MAATSNQIVNGMTFNRGDYKFAKPKVNKSGGKSINVTLSSANSSLVITTPLMLTWGVNEYVDDSSGRKTYDMSLQFPKEDYATPETTEFLERLKDFEDNIKESAIKNSKEWMNKAKLTEEVVDALFHPMLRYPKDPNTGESDYTRAPTLRIKLGYWDDKFDCEVYDMDYKALFPKEDSDVSPVDLIAKGSNVSTAIRCGGIWFANGKFGVTWRLVQSVVKPKPSLKGRCFIQLSSNEKDKLSKQVVEDDDDDAVGVEVAEDSDDEAQEQEAPSTPQVEAAPEPVEPPPAPKKKKMVKRKKKTVESTA